MNGICRFCGKNSSGVEFTQWVKDTFTDFDKLKPGNVICNECLFWFDEKSELLRERMKKEKPQKMRSYSHFVVDGKWMPFSKADKDRMLELLLGEPFPELAAISDSGQKHIVFRAQRNEKGQRSGWAQFEEKSVYVRPQELKALVDLIGLLLSVFSKKEIGSGEYIAGRILTFGFEKWQELEHQIGAWRGTTIFSLALFLSTKGESDERNQEASGDIIDGDMERDAAGLQDAIQNVDLEPIRKPSKKRGVHQQPAKISQLPLFETER